jgi:hypothetical protein
MEFVLLLPSVDVNSLLPSQIDSVDPIVSCSSGAGADDVTSSDAISVNAAGPGFVSTRVVFRRGAAFLLAAFFLPPLRTLAVVFFFMLPFFLAFERFACFPFF